MELKICKDCSKHKFNEINLIRSEDLIRIQELVRFEKEITYE